MRIVDVEHDCPRTICPICDNYYGLQPNGRCENCDGFTPSTERRIDKVTCGSCERSWCEACDPAPAAMCVWCNGGGPKETARMSVDLDDPEDVEAYLRKGAA